MSSPFARAHQRMNRIINTRLSDGTGSYVGQQGQRINCLSLSVDSKFEMGGVLETLTGNTKAVTVASNQLRTHAVRGDWFELHGKKYMVEETLFDDGHFATYACQELQ